jgi:hypothetical protein
MTTACRDPLAILAAEGIRMELVYQVAVLSELDEILAFAESRLALQISDATDRVFRQWGARWRREALEHYLQLGWSFTVRRKNSGAAAPLAGFFLGQPFLFMRGNTQTLWIEHLDGDADDVRVGLVDVAIRLSREKHLQRVLFGDPSIKDVLGSWPHSRMSDEIIEVQTTKG